MLSALTVCAATGASSARTPDTVAPCVPGVINCSVHRGYTDNGKPKLQFEGDSITTYASNDIVARFGPKYDVAINAAVGATTWLERNAVSEEASKHPAIEVIELGTNDATCAAPSGNRWACGGLVDHFDAASVTGHLRDFSDAFPSSTCVIFVTPDDHNPTWYPQYVDVIDNFERAHFVHLADWQKAWKPSYFSGTDEPHPNEAGRRSMLDLIARAVDRC